MLTIAGASGGALEGAFLLAIFAAGMAAPLLILALLWERMGSAGRARLRGREIQIGPWTRHLSVVISSALFIVLGIAFIAFQGGNALGGIYATLGASDLALTIESAVRALAIEAPLVLATVVAVPIIVILVVLFATRHSKRPDATETPG